MKNKSKQIVILSSTTLIALAAIGGVIWGISKSMANNPNSGAIYTTNANGTVVNQNIYDNKNDVYLNGGPSVNNCNSPGLPDGNYYFQVTDPSGSVILSTDDISLREVAVLNGAIIGTAGAGNHIIGSSGPCNSVSIQLMPYNDTPNQGEEYKVWMTPTSEYSPEKGFMNNSSKTDNFKVKMQEQVPPAEIHGMKFNDSNANGVKDLGEAGIQGWTTNLSGATTASTTTDSNGLYSFTNLRPGTYTVCEALPELTPPWLQTFPTSNNGCYTLTLQSSDNITDQDFGNIQTAEIHGLNFDDKNANHLYDQQEPVLSNWTITLAKPDQTTVQQQTNAAGEYAFTGLLPGTYTVCETIPAVTPAWMQTFPNPVCYSLTLAQGDNIQNQNFGNIQTAEIHAKKFCDANANGVDDNELGITNWKINLNGTDITNNNINQSSITNLSGLVDFVNLLPTIGSYQVQEIIPVNSTWAATTPTSVAQSLSEGQSASVKFGNLCLGQGGGLTLGFWSNKNGQALFATDDLALMVSLNLKNANGSNFDPSSYTAFRTWILGANATNMANMLSAQLAAMELNVLNGKVNANALVYAPGSQSANTLGYATISNLMNEANTELASHNSVLSDSPYRRYQEVLKNALDKANNNLNFVQSTPCPVVYTL